MGKSFNILKNKFSDTRKASIQKRVTAALKDMPLAELRQARKFTQQQIAQSLKIKQASVSKMESQTDMYLSTIRKYIEAMGGELEIIAKFPEGSIKVYNFESLETPQPETKQLLENDFEPKKEILSWAFLFQELVFSESHSEVSPQKFPRFWRRRSWAPAGIYEGV